MAGERELGSRGETITVKSVVIICAALGAIATFGANWFFYTRTDGRLLEQRMTSIEKVSDRQTEALQTLANSINTVQVNSVRLSEINVRLSERIDALEKKEK